jgi:Na+/H+ antiporter NhaD/arsenite permease-like protein
VHPPDAPPEIAAWLLVPFVCLLLAIALMPFVAHHFWEHHYRDVALVLVGLMLGYYLVGFHAFGREAMIHTGLEYFQFIALVGSLYVIAGGIVIEIHSAARPSVNTLLLAAGAVLANLIGTTGASMVLIRPFMRLNAGRLRPFHIIMFIFIVSNCGGCLTPVGDPPLFLGYLKGVPFCWFLQHLWPSWLFVNGSLLAVFYALDRRIPLMLDRVVVRRLRITIRGKRNLVLLALVVVSILADAVVKQRLHLHLVPCGALMQIALAVIAYKLTTPANREANAFSTAPLAEVAFLFAGIFATMVPALEYLDAHASQLGIGSPGAFYFATGTLSAFLDNAPTFLSFLQTSFGLVGMPLTAANMPQYLNGVFHVGPAGRTIIVGAKHLAAISQAAVFFGAMTYIGNGPNFMVKSIAEAAGVKMPSFLGYMRYSIPILMFILFLDWLLFV